MKGMNPSFTCPRIALSALLVLLAAPSLGARAEWRAPIESKVGELDRYVESAREAWKVPGLAVAIVKDDQVLLCRGYGVRKSGEADEVNEDTLFAIASNTKAFTAAALAMLVEEGKLDWDDRVREHLPWFESYDPYVSHEMRVRDLLCHRSGLGTFSGDLLWYGTSYTPEQILRRARHLEPTGAFRSDYGYSNLMYLAAGEVVASASGMTWPEFVRKRILEPLQMERTVTSVRDLLAAGNYAQPHKTLPDESKPIMWVNWDSMAAAGGIISSASDMAKWTRLQLRQGRIDDRQRLFGEASSREMWSAHIANRISPASKERYPSTHFRAYGLGWSLCDYKGRKLVRHGGGYDGMFSQVVLVPEENLGVVVLTNSMTWIADSLTYRVVDCFLGGTQTDWCGENLPRYLESREKFRVRIAKATTSAAPDSLPTLEPESYVGTYGGDLYGDAEVELEDGRLVLRLLPAPMLIADLKHLHYDTFVVEWRHEFAWFDQGTAQFLLDDGGQVVEMKMNVPNEDLWFHELEFKRRD